MSTSMHLPRKSVVIAALLVALAFACVTAASASASKWVQGETSMEWKASNLTLELNGGSAVSCEMFEPTGTPPWLGAQNIDYGGGYFAAEGGVTDGTWFNRVTLECDGGSSLEFCACISTEGKVNSGVYSMYMYNKWSGIPTGESPYGTYAQEGSIGTFTNGSAKAPSTLTFDDELIGYAYPGWQPITISGTIQVSQEEGGLLTIEGS